MNVSFVVKEERTFCIEVGFYESFKEVRDRVEKHEGIPVSNQTLLFNGQLLRDDEIIINSDLCEGSRIHLFLTPTITLKFTASFSVEMGLNDTVLQVKKKICELKISPKLKPNDQLSLQLLGTGKELLHHRSLRDCGISNTSHVYMQRIQPNLKNNRTLFLLPQTRHYQLVS